MAQSDARINLRSIGGQTACRGTLQLFSEIGKSYGQSLTTV